MNVEIGFQRGNDLLVGRELQGQLGLPGVGGVREGAG